MRRLRLGEWLAAAGGVALIVSLLLPWYDALSGFESFAVIDVLLCLVAIPAIALAVLQATQRGPAVPVGTAVVTVPIGLIGVLLVLYRIVDQPGPNDLVDVRAGAYVGLAATVAILAGAWESLRNEHVPGAAPPEDVEVRPAPRIAPDAQP
jgi:hypothetical protein